MSHKKLIINKYRWPVLLWTKSGNLRCRTQGSRYLGHGVNHKRLVISNHRFKKCFQQDQLNWNPMYSYSFMAAHSSFCFLMLSSLVITRFLEWERVPIDL